MITDEDIDLLLRRGEQRTQAESDKIKTEMQHNLANFSFAITVEDSLGGDNLQGGDNNGVNGDGASGGGSGVGKRKASELAGIVGVSGTSGFISLPQRERKKTIDVDSYFKEVLSVNQPNKDKDAPKTQSKKKRQIFAKPDFQFFDKPFMEAYALQEEILLHQRNKQVELIKTLTAKESKLRRASMRKAGISTANLPPPSASNLTGLTGHASRENLTATPVSVSSAMSAVGISDNNATDAEDGAATAAMDTDDTGGSSNPHPSQDAAAFGSVVFPVSTVSNPEADAIAAQIAQLQQEIVDGKFDMPADQVALYNEKMADSFGEWDRFDFKAFVDAVERAGRNREKVAKIVFDEVRMSLLKAIDFDVMLLLYLL
jgi:hypothetical protein